MKGNINVGRMIIAWACTGFVLVATKTPVASWEALACLLAIWLSLITVSDPQETPHDRR